MCSYFLNPIHLLKSLKAVAQNIYVLFATAFSQIKNKQTMFSYSSVVFKKFRFVLLIIISLFTIVHILHKYLYKCYTPSSINTFTSHSHPLNKKFKSFDVFSYNFENEKSRISFFFNYAAKLKIFKTKWVSFKKKVSTSCIN